MAKVHPYYRIMTNNVLIRVNGGGNMVMFNRMDIAHPFILTVYQLIEKAQIKIETTERIGW